MLGIMKRTTLATLVCLVLWSVSGYAQEIPGPQRGLQGRGAEGQYSPQRSQDDRARDIDTNSVRVRRVGCLHKDNGWQRSDDGRLGAAAGGSQSGDVRAPRQRNRRDRAAQSLLLG